jgi:hypothetical protein
MKEQRNMIYTSRLRAINEKRNNIFRILGIMVVPAPFLAIGLGMLIGSLKHGQYAISVVGAAITILGLWIGVKLFNGVYAIKRQAYQLFEENDVFVLPTEPVKREIDKIALEKFQGNLKQALHYVATTPELYRREREKNMLQWCDYERDYIAKHYGKDPLHVAQVSRTDALTHSIIISRLLERSAIRRGTSTNYDLIKTQCTAKSFFPGTDGEMTSYYLHFGDHGKCECEQNLYYITQEGETFYVVTVRGERSVAIAYPAAEWTPDETLQAVLSEE